MGRKANQNSVVKRLKSPTDGRNRYAPEKVSFGVELASLPEPLIDLADNGEALQLYHFVGGELIRSGKLATTDILSLQLYCLELADYLHLRRKVGKAFIDATSGSQKPNPLAILALKKLAEVTKLGRALGLSPASRALASKVTAPVLPGSKGMAKPVDLDLD